MSSLLNRPSTRQSMGTTSASLTHGAFRFFKSTSEQTIDSQWRERRVENEQERRALEAKHRDSYAAWLENATAAYKRMELSDILVDLSQKWGTSWADIARMAEVSVPALRKWRTAGGATPIKKVRLAGIAGFMQVLDELGISEPADWINEPIKDGYTVTPRHLYSPTNASTLLDLAGGSSTADMVLNVLAPEWRTKFATSFVVETLPNGEKAIVSKSNKDG